MFSVQVEIAAFIHPRASSRVVTLLLNLGVHYALCVPRAILPIRDLDCNERDFV